MGMEEASPASNGTNEISDLENKIIRQIEYYFGDFNLRRDKFLKTQIEENEGWIPLETMVKFNRLKEISEDFEVIATALRKSPNDLLEVNEEGTHIRRNPLKPLSDETDQMREDVMNRSVYVKGFKADTSLDELIEFFKQHGNAENILMRRIRTGKKKFKGSIFVTFKAVEEVKPFLDKEVVSYKGTTLLRETKKDYLARKEVEYLERKKASEEKHAKKQAKAEQAENEAMDKDEKPDSKQEISHFTKGCLLKLSGFEEGTMREDIKPVLEPHGTVSFIDFAKGDPEAVIRFESPVAAEVLEKVSKEVDGARRIEIKGVDVLAIVLEGEDEEQYFRNVKRRFQEKKNRHKGGRHNRGGFGRGGKHKGGFRKGKGKRKFDNEDETEESHKKIKEEKSQTKDDSSESF